MPKIDLQNFSSLTNESSTITRLNQNNAVIEVESDSFLSRDGTSPNKMMVDLDMDSNRVLNLPDPIYPLDVVRLKDMQDASFGGGISTIATDSFPNLVAVEATTIEAGTKMIYVEGRVTPGDLGGAHYKFVTTQPTHMGKVKSADGAWWEIAEPMLIVEMFGGANEKERYANLATCGYTQFVPIYIKDFDIIHTIRPVAERDLSVKKDVGCHAVIQRAINWQGSCIKRGNGSIELEIVGPDTYTITNPYLTGTGGTTPATVTGCGEIPVYGQFLMQGTLDSGDDANSFSFSMPPAFSVDIDDAFNVTIGPRLSWLTQITMEPEQYLTRASYAYQWNQGYVEKPTITVHPEFTEDGGVVGTGFEAEAFLENGKIKGIKIVNAGTGWVAPPAKIGTVPNTFSQWKNANGVITPKLYSGKFVPLVITGGGPGGSAPTHVARAEGYMNPSIYLCTIRVKPKPSADPDVDTDPNWQIPAYVKKGSIIGIHGYGSKHVTTGERGVNDAGAINGCHTVHSVVHATKSISFYITAPRLRPATEPPAEDPDDEWGDLKTGTPLVVLPGYARVALFKTWLKNTGGYYGAGEGEGMFSCSGNHSLTMTDTAIRFRANEFVDDDEDETPTPAVSDQCGWMAQKDGALIYGKTGNAIADFPGSGIRMAHGILFFVSGFVGGGPRLGLEGYLGVQTQNYGSASLVRSAVGSSNATCVVIQGGNTGYVNHCSIGAGNIGFLAYSFADLQGTRIFSCNTGVSAAVDGVIFAGTPVNVDTCRLAIDVSNGGKFLGTLGTEIAPIFFGNKVDTSMPGNTTGLGGGGFYSTAPAAPPKIYTGGLYLEDTGGTGNPATSGILTQSAAIPGNGVATLTLTKESITENSIILANVKNGTNLTGRITIGRITPVDGSAQITILNTHPTEATAGTIIVTYGIIAEKFAVAKVGDEEGSVSPPSEIWPPEPEIDPFTGKRLPSKD